MKRVEAVYVDASFVGYRSMTKFLQQLGFESKYGWIATGTVYSFLKDLMFLLENYSAKEWVVVWDSKPTVRLELDGDYKANRRLDETEESQMLRSQMRHQLKEIKAILRYTGINQKIAAGYEADDLLATVSSQKSGLKLVVARDKDLYQILGNEVILFDFVSEKDQDWFESQYGIKPEQWIAVQALTGDSTDNVKGIKGIGVKTAISLVRKYGSLETLLEDTQVLPNVERSMVYKAEELVRLCCNIENIVEIPGKFDPIRLRRFLERKKMVSLQHNMSVFQKASIFQKAVIH